MPKRIVHMLNSMGMGGIENFIMNVYREIDREKYQFDFILQCEENSYFEKEILKMGGKIYKIPRIEKHPLKHIKELKRILKENDYLAFHRHTASSVVFIDLMVAKQCKIKNRIVHSHNTSNNGIFLNKLFRSFLSHYATTKLACSEDAGKWLYHNRSFEVICNAIDTQKYIFNESIREKYRQELNIKDNIVIGHVGRFNEQKNHKFLIEMFHKLYQNHPNYRLLLCGAGDLENEIKELCKNYAIEDAVIFAGIRKDIPEIMQAMDIFAFPSLYEGLGIVLIEAQMTNLPSVVSHTIPKEAIYHQNVYPTGINKEDIDAWVEKILLINPTIENRTQISEKLLNDYDIKNVTNKLIEIYERGE